MIDALRRMLTRRARRRVHLREARYDARERLVVAEATLDPAMHTTPAIWALRAFAVRTVAPAGHRLTLRSWERGWDGRGRDWLRATWAVAERQPPDYDVADWGFDQP